MNIQPLSDLHLEMIKNTFSIPASDADVIVLAGDIHQGIRGVEWAAGEARRLQKPIVYVPGNHEHYRQEYHANMAAMRAEAAKSSLIHFLEKDEIVINGVRFLGVALWTDYMATGVDQQAQNMKAALEMSDHQLIRYETGRFEPEHALSLHIDAVEWLEKKLNEPFDGRTVVVTHHGPSLECIHLDHGYDSIPSCFYSDLDRLVKKADIWLYGHTHSNLDTHIGKCRLVSNQKGYPGEKMPAENTFQPDRVVSI